MKKQNIRNGFFLFVSLFVLVVALGIYSSSPATQPVEKTAVAVIGADADVACAAGLEGGNSPLCPSATPPPPTSTDEPTDTPVPTLTKTTAPTLTKTPKPTKTKTPPPTLTETPTDTPEPTDTKTPPPTKTATWTKTPPPTLTETPTDTPEPTDTKTPTLTKTPTPSQTITTTPSKTATNTPTPTATFTLTPSPTVTGTPVQTQTSTPTPPEEKEEPVVTVVPPSSCVPWDIAATRHYSDTQRTDILFGRSWTGETWTPSGLKYRARTWSNTRMSPTLCSALSEGVEVGSKTGYADIYLVGSEYLPVNLTNTPNIDERNPVWLTNSVFIYTADGQAYIQNLYTGEKEKLGFGFGEMDAGDHVVGSNPQNEHLLAVLPQGYQTLSNEHFPWRIENPWMAWLQWSVENPRLSPEGDGVAFSKFGKTWFWSFQNDSITLLAPDADASELAFHYSTSSAKLLVIDGQLYLQWFENGPLQELTTSDMGSFDEPDWSTKGEKIQVENLPVSELPIR